jgi:hypothetical protein
MSEQSENATASAIAVFAKERNDEPTGALQRTISTCEVVRVRARVR